MEFVLIKVCKSHIMYVLLYIKTYKMLTATISDFRKDIKRYLDKVSKNFETLIINRGKDSGIVIISLDEYNSLTATQHELSSRINEQRLDSAISKFETKKDTFTKELLD